jgi:hypothetical protein
MCLPDAYGGAYIVLLLLLQAADAAKEPEEAGDNAAAMDVDGPAAEEQEVSIRPCATLVSLIT